MKIETDRLILEKATLDDSEFFLRLLNSPNWLEFIGDRGVRNLDDSANYIQKSLIGSYNNYGFGLYKVMLKQVGTPIGICGFVQRNYLEKVNIGFAVLPEFEGAGYITEAAIATLEYGVNELKFDEIQSITSKENMKSQHLLSKIGMKLIGNIRPNKSNDELLLYSNLKSDAESF